MTIVVAYRDDARGEVWVGADSRASGHEGFIWPKTARKIIAVGPWRIGFAGSASTGQIIIDCAAEIAACDMPMAVYRVMVREWDARGYHKCDHGGLPCFEQHLLIAAADRAWIVPAGSTPSELDDGFFAIGAGDNFAYGAAYAIMSVAQGEITGDVICRVAIEAACKYSADCGGKIVVEKVE